MISVTWLFKFSFRPMVMPRYFILPVHLMGTLQITIGQIRCGRVWPNRTATHFDGFILSFHLENQVLAKSNYLYSWVLEIFQFWLMEKNFVSSAYSTMCACFWVWMSFVNILNRVVERNEPCGTHWLKYARGRFFILNLRYKRSVN